MDAPRTPPGLPPQLAARPRALKIAAAVAVAAALGSIVAGWLVRGVTEPAPRAAVAPPARTVHAGAAGVAVPGDWTPVTAVPGILGQSPPAAAVLGSGQSPPVAAVPGVPGQSPPATVAFQPVTALPAYALIAFAPVQDGTLVPAPLRALLGKAVPKPKPTMLGGAHAWRYGETPIAGGRTMEVTVAPTSTGVLAIACIARTEAWVAALGCAQRLRSVWLDRGTWLRPGPEVAARAQVQTAIAGLNHRRVALRAKLKAARSNYAQYRLARRLSAAYAQTANDLARSVPRSGAPARVIVALRGASAANLRLAVAARNRWPKRYRLARATVARGDAALARSLAALREP